MAFEISIEELLPWFGLEGEGEVYGLPSPDVPPDLLGTVNNPTNIIQTNQQWEVKINWTQSGWLNNIMAGTWKLKVLLEQMGKEEIDLDSNGELDVPHVPTPGHNYEETITIDAKIVPAGVYRLVLALTMVGPADAPGPIAGFGDGGLLQFYQAP